MIGIHCSKKSPITSIENTELADAVIREVEEFGLNSAQVYLHGPYNSKRVKSDLKLLADATKDIYLTTHSAFTSVSIWKVNKSNINTRQSKIIIKSIIEEIKSCVLAGSSGLVIHVGKQYTTESIAETIDIFKPHFKKYRILLMIEMVASIANQNTYETPEKINKLTQLVGRAKWWGWCVDTAHLWGAGIDIQEYSTMKEWLNAVSADIILFHLNGSSNECGSGKDKHEAVFANKDLIWGIKSDIKHESSGCLAVLEYATKYKIPIIMEVKRNTKEEVEYSLNFIKKNIN